MLHDTDATAIVDLSSCGTEPIHIIGAVQPHGVLVAVDESQLRIVHASDNTLGLFGVGPRDLIGQSLDVLLGGENLELVHDAASRSTIEEANPLVMRVKTLRGDTLLDAVLHRSGKAIVIELEEADGASPLSYQDFYQNIRSAVERFDSAQTVAELCEIGVHQIARLSNFDRVMVYRFDEDWHGEVLAEQRLPSMTSYLGLHFPASDIPPQARDIFKRNWLRFVPDVSYRPTPIVPERSGPTGEALDLTRSVLRSVSALHVEYLQNMGVAATLTISLLRNGELWGLVACHNTTPRMLPLAVRSACEVIGRTMSLHLGVKEENEETTYRMRIKSIQLDLIEAMSQNFDFFKTLATAQPHLLSLVGADGAAIRFNDDVTLLGSTPERDDVLAILDWVLESAPADVFVSDRLPIAAPRFAELASSACGIIALPFSPDRRNMIVWFRPEVVQTINWGGAPDKPIAISDDGLRVSPRKSFALWRETARMRSRRWKRFEIEAALEWRRFVYLLIVERAEQLDEIDELRRTNVELDAFAHIASHDLKEPLRGIRNYASYLIDDYAAVLDDDGRTQVETLTRLSLRIEALINALLVLSAVGRVEFTAAPIRLSEIVDDVVAASAAQLERVGGAVSIVTPLPTVLVDRLQLFTVLANLISNGVKYNDGVPHIEVGVASEAAVPAAGRSRRSSFGPAQKMGTVFVRDNGIGIPQTELLTIFQMFKRLHVGDHYGGGTGAGLAIARKIVERHGGNIWVESDNRSQSTFYFTVPLSL